MVDAHHPVIEDHPRLAPLVRFSRSTSVVAGTSPLCGDDTDEVLAAASATTRPGGPSCGRQGCSHERARRSDDDWLRNRAAIVGIGHTPCGKRGEHAEKGHLRLVVEAITGRLRGRRHLAEGRRRLQLVLHVDRALRPVRRRSAPSGSSYTAQTWGGGGASMGGAFPNAAMAVATGQADYVVVHKVMTMEGTGRYGQAFGQIGQRPPTDGGPDGVLGAVRPAVTGPDVRAGRPAAHAPVRHDHRPLRRGDDQRPPHGREQSRGPLPRPRSRSRTTTTAG